jgi:hypothetical protein
MTSGISKSLVFLPTGLCLLSDDLDRFCQIPKTLQKELFQLLLDVSRNPNNASSLLKKSPEELAPLRTARILEGNTISRTLLEVLKTCYNPETQQIETSQLRRESFDPPPIKAPIPRETRRLQIKPLPVKDPPQEEIHQFYSQIKGSNSILQEVIAKGGLNWKIDRDCFYSNRIREGTLQEALCQKALDNDDLKLLETILPHLTQSEILQRIEANLTNSYLFETETGIRLLQSCNDLRSLILREALPGSHEQLHFKVAKIAFFKEVFSELEYAAIVKQKIPTRLLNQLFIWRMRSSYYKDWCAKILNSPYKANLNGQQIMDELLKLPSSKHRSEIALYTTISFGILHPSLKEKTFRHEEPEDSDCIRISIDNSVSRYLENASLNGNFEAIRLIRDNFAQLLVNKKAMRYFNHYLNPDAVRKSKQELRNLINSLEVQLDPTQTNAQIPVTTVRKNS